jgi:pilus assembly protein TadC
MKLFLAILAYLMIGLVLGWGILLTVKGQPWLLIVGFVVYAVAFAKLGCLPKESHPHEAGHSPPE